MQVAFFMLRQEGMSVASDQSEDSIRIRDHFNGLISFLARFQQGFVGSSIFLIFFIKCLQIYRKNLFKVCPSAFGRLG